MTAPSNPIDKGITRFASFFGSHAKEVDRFVKFFIVGLIGATVDFSTLNILQRTILVPIDPHHNLKIGMATGISFAAAVLSNFFWNRYWTYPDSRSRSLRRQLAMFYGVNTTALLFRLAFVGITFNFFAGVGESFLREAGLVSGALSIEAQHQLGTNISQALAVLMAMFWNFTANRLWTYNDVD
jgi:putative flippase GtrA